MGVEWLVVWEWVGGMGVGLVVVYIWVWVNVIGGWWYGGMQRWLVV